MEDQVQRLVDKVWAKFLDLPPERRFMVGIGGIPGSGKTTLSQLITTSLNTRHSAHAPAYPSSIAAFVPMDGYHLTRAQLSAMPDPATAHARRGAEFTFDGASFLALVQTLRHPLPASSSSSSSSSSPLSPPHPALTGATPSPGEALPPHTIFAPSFDHALKDPKDADIPILPTQRIVVFEGNYIALDKEPWRSAARLMDEVWFVEVDFAVARKRLAKRHLKAGLVATEEEGDRRALENDLPNGEEIVGARIAVDEVVKSREDGAWVGE